MIKKFGNYENVKAYGDYEQLPKGAYILKILNAETGESQYGQFVKISCDIIEGEYAGFFQRDFDNQQSEDKKWHCNYLLNVPVGNGTERDDWTARRFKTVIAAIEDSNPGYHFDWDETKFKGKVIGGLFNIREYQKNNGEIGEAVNLAQLVSVETVKSGKFKMPKDKKLNTVPVPDRKMPSMPTTSANVDDCPF